MTPVTPKNPDSTKIPELKAYYETLTHRQKREFIEKLHEKIQGNYFATKHWSFLNECIEDYNAAIAKWRLKAPRLNTIPIEVVNAAKKRVIAMHS